MESTIFKYVLRYSKPQQIVLLSMTTLSMPFIYWSLNLPKAIINDAIDVKKDEAFPLERSFYPFEFQLADQAEQIWYLGMLCLVFLALVCFNGGFKYFINVYRGVLAERMLRRLRYMLMERVMRFPIPHFRNISQGEVVAMVTTETEPLGGFIGDALSLPAYQGGTFVIILAFIFIQDWRIGIAAIALYPIQAYIIPKLQRRVNLLGKERVRHVRKLSERIGETVTGIHEVHAHDVAQFELADYSERLGDIFQIRRRIFRLKFFTKFLNNFLGQLTPFFFFSVGGYLVIKGNLTFGALVAVLAAYKDLQPLWKELLGYYQRMEDAKIKYDQIREQFMPAGMLEPELIEAREEPPEAIGGQLVASNLSLEEEEGSKVVDGASFAIEPSQHVAVVGPPGSGKTELARLLARQISPTGGHVSVGDKRMESLPDAVTGRRLTYVDQEAYIRAGTIREALLYGLQRYPARPAEYDEEVQAKWQAKIDEAVSSGNSPLDIHADWIDYAAAGVADADELKEKMAQSLRAVDLEDDIFEIGLRRIIDPADHPDLAQRVLEARSIVHEKLKDKALADLVEVFDKEKFNTNASVAENILFGTPVGETLDIEKLGQNPYVLSILEKTGLDDDFLEMGRSVAALMVELFQDLPPGHEFFEQFAFFDSDDIPEFQRILNFVGNKGFEDLDEADKAKLIDLPFKLIPGRHHMDLVDEAMQARLLEARSAFAEALPEEYRDAVEFFDAEKYNAASSIQDNILFGKMADAKVQSASRIGELLAQVVNDLGLRPAVLDVGLAFDVGIAGKRLSAAQRQQLAIARSLLKRPEILIVNEATAPLDASTQATIFGNVKKEMEGRGLVWVTDAVDGDNHFDRVLSMDRGRVTEQAAGESPRPAASEDVRPESAGSGLGHETELLAGISFFAGMDRSKLKLLAFTSKRQEFEADQIVFRQGDIGETAFLVIDGSFDVIVDTAQGPHTIATRGKGELVGELALLCDAPRTATIRANEAMSVLSISKDVFLKLVLENTEVSANVTRIVAGRLEGTLRSLGELTSYYDALTGLPNRQLFADRAKQAVSQAKRDTDRASSLIIIGFKNVDEAMEKFGPTDKDRVLKDAALRVKDCLREVDTLTRLDDLGLGIIASASSEPVNTEILVERIGKVLAEPFAIDGQSVSLEGMLDFDVWRLDEENLPRIIERYLKGQPS